MKSQLTPAVFAIVLGVVSWTTAQAADPVATASSKHAVQRASKVIGMHVKNAQDQDLGEVNDVVMDVTNGKIHYLAVSYGGILGLGDKLFAIPADVFQLKHGEDESFLMISVDEQTLKNAPGFDQDRWPNFSDKAWYDKVNEHYRKFRRRAAQQDRPEVEIQAGRARVSVDVADDRTAVPNTATSATDTARTALKDTVLRASKMIGMTVKNHDNKQLGEVNDIVIDLDRGQATYMALSYGGFLGLGDKLFAVPFRAFQVQQGEDEGEHFFVVDIDEQSLKNAPGFSQDSWPDLGNPRWSEDIDRHYKLPERSARRQTVPSDE